MKKKKLKNKFQKNKQDTKKRKKAQKINDDGDNFDGTTVGIVTTEAMQGWEWLAEAMEVGGGEGGGNSRVKREKLGLGF